MMSASSPSANEPAKDLILLHRVHLKPIIKAHSFDPDPTMSAQYMTKTQDLPQFSLKCHLIHPGIHKGAQT